MLTAELVGLRIVNEVRSACFGPRRGAETSLGLDKADDAVEAFALHEIGHDKRPSAAHAPGVGFHFFQRCADMRAKFPELDMVLIESGGDNLAATFSPELADLTIYVIDVAAGDKIPSKGGPGITRSDLLVINKIDLAPHVGASLEKMDTDARRMRGERPFVMTNLRKSEGLDRIVSFIEAKGGLSPAPRAKAS